MDYKEYVRKNVIIFGVNVILTMEIRFLQNEIQTYTPKKQD